MNCQMDRWRAGWMDVGMGGKWMDGWVDEWMDRWLVGRMD